LSSRSPEPRGAIRSALALVVALAALGTLGCEERLRTNPLDPLNPETGGGPSTFLALAQNGQVELRWSRAPVRPDLVGFLLERRRVGPNAFIPIAPILAPESTGEIDLFVTNDLDYEYRLSYVDADTNTIGTPALSLARPGPEVGWVADTGADEIVRLTPDARARYLTIGGVRTANRISVDPGDGSVWATEPFNGSVKTFDSDGASLSFFPAGVNPNAISVVPGGSDVAWICDEGTGRVARFTRGGTFQFEAGVFQLPTDIVSTTDGGAWMVDEEDGRLFRFNGTGGTVFATPLGSDPRRIALDQQNGTVWVTRYGPGELLQVDTDGEIVQRIVGLPGPYGVDVDEARDHVWVGLDDRNAVRVFDRVTGAELFEVTNIAGPRGLTVVDRTGECWVAAVESREIVRIEASGLVASRLGGFDAPLDVRVVQAGSAPRVTQNK
jgi:DNA-binding beta-propeller fold protein YncE